MGQKHNLVVVESVYDAFISALTRHQAAVLDEDESTRFVYESVQSTEQYV